MLAITLHTSIEAIGREAWDACFAGQLEGYDYLLAAEHAGIAGFEWRYLVACEAETVVAAMPAFFTRYHLDTTLDPGRLRDFLQRIKRRFPRFLSLNLACLGSAVTEFGEIGWHARITDDQKPEILNAMLNHFETHAKAAGYALQAVKDYPVARAPYWASALQARRYATVGGLPIAALNIDFTGMDSYFATLSHATRKDMRRKLRRRDEVRTEIITTLPDALLPQLMALYHDTHKRADMQFEELTPDFFRHVMAYGAGRAFCVLYYVGEELLAFNLLLRDGTTLLDKYFCMDSTRGRAFNLYFLSWFVNLEFCLGAGLKRFQSGAAGYDSKLRLGSRLETTRMAYRHTNPFIHRLLRMAAPLLEPENPIEDGER